MDKKTNVLPDENKERVCIRLSYRLLFLYMKMIWPLERYLRFGVFQRKGHKWKYSGSKTNYITDTLGKIPLGVINQISKLTSLTPKTDSERVKAIAPHHENFPHKVSISPYILPTIGKLCKYMGSKQIISDMKNVLNPQYKEKIKILFFVLHSLYFSKCIHTVVDRQKSVKPLLDKSADSIPYI